MSSHIVLDLSRLLWRADRFAPTGIDRVELAYARHLIANARGRLSFVAWWHRLGLLPDDLAIGIVDALHALWSGSVVDDAARRRVTSIARRLRAHILVLGEWALYARLRRIRDPLVYLLVSHYRLDFPRPFRRFKERTGARFVCLVHDLIPIQFPETVEEGDAERHQSRLRTVEQLADLVILNSRGTRDALADYLGPAAARAVPMHVAPLGVDLHLNGNAAPGAGRRRPYFVCVSTIEPRKNHRLLLDLWRLLAAEFGDNAPGLVVVGRRGWLSDDVIETMYGAPELRGLVEECNNLPDVAVATLVAGACASLYPSFAEGYGLPVAEALALGVPVVCSDLPELREVGRQVPDYLDPRDPASWYRAVLDYADLASPRRQAQMRRLAAWQAPSWERHFEVVQPLIDNLVPPALAPVTSLGAVRASQPALLAARRVGGAAKSVGGKL